MTAPALSATKTEPPAPSPRGSRTRRTCVFGLGCVLHLLGAAAWLLSVLLMAPLMLAGLWVWSHEFDWAERWHSRCRHWSDRLWRRARSHPVRWGITTAVSLGVTGTVYWLLVA